jgi:pimeloyl-ACP methyl ester carboxylesterase
VLGIVGDEDTTFLQPMRDIVATVPGAELVVVPGAGHSPQFENPPIWLKAMESFLALVPR